MMRLKQKAQLDGAKAAGLACQTQSSKNKSKSGCNQIGLQTNLGGSLPSYTVFPVISSQLGGMANGSFNMQEWHVMCVSVQILISSLYYVGLEDWPALYKHVWDKLDQKSNMNALKTGNVKLLPNVYTSGRWKKTLE